MSRLTQEERALLERHYDGEVAGSEKSRAERLLESSATARVFVSALEEITTATRTAEEYAWSTADAPDASKVTELAVNASELTDAPLEELAPLLERFHDGEVVAEEVATVHALLQERDDVSDYLASLDELRTSVQAGAEMVGEGVDFSGFWDAVEKRIEAGETDFDREEHQVLLYRYHDDEVTSEERARVEAWIESGDEHVVQTLAALDEVQLSVTAGLDYAQENVELGAIWAGVQDVLDEEIEAQGDNVVSLGREKRERESRITGLSQGVIGAIAAILCVTLIGALFHEQLFSPDEKVIVKEKTIVIVDSVEYEPGSSVMVNSPMQPASMISSQKDGEEIEEPTVIWVFDSEPEGGEGVAPEAGQEAPGEEPGAAPDMGAFEGKQPI